MGIPSWRVEQLLDVTRWVHPRDRAVRGDGVAAQIDERPIVRDVEMRRPIGDIIRNVVYDRHRHTAGLERVDVEGHGEQRVPVDVDDVSRGNIAATCTRGDHDFALAGCKGQHLYVRRVGSTTRKQHHLPLGNRLWPGVRCLTICQRCHWLRDTSRGVNADEATEDMGRDTIVSSAVQLAPRSFGASHTVSGAPPSTETRLSL